MRTLAFMSPSYKTNQFLRVEIDLSRIVRENEIFTIIWKKKQQKTTLISSSARVSTSWEIFQRTNVYLINCFNSFFILLRDCIYFNSKRIPTANAQAKWKTETLASTGVIHCFPGPYRSLGRPRVHPSLEVLRWLILSLFALSPSNRYAGDTILVRPDGNISRVRRR